MEIINRDFLLNVFKYDKKNGKLFWKRSGPGIPNNKEAGCITGGIKYRSVRLNKKLYRTHRLIWMIEHNSWPKHELDHINGNRLDNRIKNLRDVSRRKNGCNKETHRNGKLPGASFNRNGWNSMMWLNGKTVYLGRFRTEKEAHNRYIQELRTLGHE